MPGAHLLSRDCGEWGALADEIKTSGTATTLAPSLSEIRLTAPKGQGTAVLLHHSMFHRGTARLVDEAGEPLDEMVRPMFKFIFTRCHEPAAPDWDASGDGAPDWASLATEPSMAPVLQSLWEWQTGAGNAPLQDGCDVPAALAQVLSPYAEGDEAERTGAAYALARAARSGDAEALSALLTALSQRDCPAGRRCAGHALTSAGPNAVAPLLTALAAAVATFDWELGVDAADALGEVGGGTGVISLIESLSVVAMELHDLVGQEEWEKTALVPGHNRHATGPDAVVGSLVLGKDASNLPSRVMSRPVLTDCLCLQLWITSQCALQLEGAPEVSLKARRVIPWRRGWSGSEWLRRFARGSCRSSRRMRSIRCPTRTPVSTQAICRHL